MNQFMPRILLDWSESPRIRSLNGYGVGLDGSYVLCWLQQALRAWDNPVIDAAITLANDLAVPVLVHHGLHEDYPYASDRQHRFILEASRDLARGCHQRGLAYASHVCREGSREEALVHRLASSSVAVFVDDQPTSFSQQQSQCLAKRADRTVFAVNAACLVPPAVLGDDIGSTSKFRRRHQTVRNDWLISTDLRPSVAPYDGSLPFVPDRLEDCTDADIDRFVAGAAIDHTLPSSAIFPLGRDGAVMMIERLKNNVLPHYAAARNDATRPEGASMLSPYMHYGIVGPREVMAAVKASKAPENAKNKFIDELLIWREWFHYQARALSAPERYDRISLWARETLATHASDERPELETFDALLNGATRDETWNACQRQFLIDGWMHNNLRMYWCRRMIAMTPDPETAWATACYINDRLSLDGGDPSTYGNIAMSFGGGLPAQTGADVYGTVPMRCDGSTRRRHIGPEWLEAAAKRPTPELSVHVHQYRGMYDRE